jgi:cytidylate kinase
MAIVTISRGSYSRGRDVAEKVAERLGYECIAREVLLEAAQQFNVPEVQLLEAVQVSPSALDPLAQRKKKYVATIQAALLRHVRNDRVVYHGFAGHFFLRSVPHAVKVLIFADMEQRIRIVMERDGKTFGEAAQFLENVDEQRRKWSQSLYGRDPWDPTLYDLVLNINQLTVEGATELIYRCVELPEFRATTESIHTLEDLLLAAEVRIALAELCADMRVHAHRGLVRVDCKAPKSEAEGLAREIERIANAVPGVTELRMDVLSFPA